MKIPVIEFQLHIHAHTYAHMYVATYICPHASEQLYMYTTHIYRQRKVKINQGNIMAWSCGGDNLIFCILYIFF